MILWLLGGGLTLVVLALIIAPLLKPSAPAATRLDYDLEVYKDQLAELDRDAARGAIAPAEAEAARIEIQRRILAAANVAKGRAAAPPPRPAWGLVLAVVVGLPFLGGALYLALGRPDLPSQSATRDAPLRDPTLARRLAALEAKADAHPKDLAARLAVAEFEFGNRRFHSAARAYRIALTLSNGRGDIAGLYGEALTRANGGLVTRTARRAFGLALAANPDDPRAHFFLGLADSQDGNYRAALTRWLKLEAASPADASWLPTLRSEMSRVADEANIDLAGLRRTLDLSPKKGAPGPGPSAADIDAAKKLSPDQRMQMIRGMVDRLAARLKENPQDLEGWKRLGRAWSVLGEHAKSADAYRHALALAPDDTQLMADLASAIIRAQPKGKEVTPEAVAVLKKLLARDPDNALALFYLGLAAADAGDKEEAASHWGKLLARLPQDAPVRDLIKKRLAALGATQAK
jgi:cytochrome c-type biogenesis protein CcmH